MFQPEILSLLDESPPLPTRSRLMPMKPMNDTLPIQESLSSYFVRLARKHSCSPMTLLRNEVLAWTKIKYSREASSRFTSNYIRTMNGVSFYAKELAEALNNLTGQSELDRCSFLPLTEVLDPRGNGLLHHRPHWCSECFRDWRVSGNEPYFPLIWMAAPVKFCKTHQCTLSDTCPHCGQAQPFLPKHSYLDHCSHCGKWLSTSTITYLKNIDDFSLYQYNSIEEMIVNGWRCSSLLNSSSFINSIKVVAGELYNGSIYEMERELGFPKGTVSNWSKSNVSPSLPNLLSFSYSLGVSPLEFITLLDNQRIHPNIVMDHRKQASKRKGLSVDEFSLVKSVLDSVISSGISEKSVQSIARDLGYTVTLLRYWFKEECQVISRLYREYKNSCRIKNEQKDIDVVKDIFKRLTDKKTKITNRILQNELSFHGVILSRPHVLAAVEDERKKRLLF